MSRSLGYPSRSGGPTRGARIGLHGTWAAVVVLVVIVGSLSLLVPVAHAGGASAPTAPAASRVAPGVLPPTHGDLVVGPGQQFIIQPTLAGRTYYQGGNITVEHGGTLIVRNVTLSFVQFVADSGTPQQRLSHIYHFIDNGTLNFYNAILTTDVDILNAYAKLNLTVTAGLSAWNSTFAFPGWIDVAGSSAVMTLNGSSITSNPSVSGLIEMGSIYGDTLFSASVSVTAGATLNLLRSSISNTYADNQITYGVPRPTPLSFPAVVLSGNVNMTPLVTPSDSANLTLDWSYPAAGARSGFFQVTYVDTNPSLDTSASISIWFAGTQYAIGSVLFKNSSLGVLTLPFTAGLLSAITHAGMLSYLNDTGAFGGLPSRISIDYTAVAGPGVALASNVFQLNTSGLSYDMTVSGAGSTLSAADSALALTWNLMPPGDNPYALLAPYPWSSNKLLLQNGAKAYLANMTVPTLIPGVFSASAVQPDATSQSFLYRWAQFNLTGRGGNLAVQGAHLSAYYAYDTNQANNATVNALNNLPATDPVIWGYVQYWDSLHGVPSYGTSNSAGNGFLLLASGNITGSTLPDGLFLGGYHIGVSVPANSIGSHWFNWSVQPYPTGVALGTAHYFGPDFGPAQSFANYYGAMGIVTQVVLANGVAVANDTVRIGQTLSIQVTLNDTGTATITQVGGGLFYNATSATSLGTANLTGLQITTPGQKQTFNLTWVVNDSVTGLQGRTFNNSFALTLEFNYGQPNRGGGVITASVVVAIAPSQVRIVSFTPPVSTTIQLTGSYLSVGALQYNGSQKAVVAIYLTPVSGGAAILVAEAQTISGNFELTWFALQQLLSAGTTYTMSVVATYNGVSTTYHVAAQYSVPAPPSSPTSFLTQIILGLPLWVWLAIAGAIVAGLLVFLMFARRQAAGKLVECGECGNLIPEDATVCPKCGAEFETDLIRCSRCASTIPADSKFCPECAAQLLGKPGEGEADPERQGYADFTEKYRAEGKRELGENYSEGAFWDWWKRQPTYTSFSQWKLQQGSGTPRAGMTAPPMGSESMTDQTPTAGRPPRGGGGMAAGTGALPSSTAAPPPPVTGAAATAAPMGAAGGPLKACPNCGKEIPPEYLVCPFCGAVTQ